MKRILWVLVTLIVLALGNVNCRLSEPQTVAPAPTRTTPETAKAVSWDKASSYVGQRVTVFGPVVDTRYASGSRGQPTFLDIGRAYPDPSRFTVIIWGDNRANFSQPPEIYYEGKSIYVAGLVTEYRGGAEIEVKSPAQIQER